VRDDRVLTRTSFPTTTLWSIAKTGRLSESGVVFGGTLVGARLAYFADWQAVVLIAISNTLLFAASMMINDAHDVAEDSINKPKRAVASGRLPAGLAYVGGAACFLAAIVLAALVDVRFAVLALAITVLSGAYTLWLKGVPLVGNGLVAIISTYPLSCWLLVALDPTLTYATLIASCVAFRLGAEVLKTAEDAVGDAAQNIRTVATKMGVLFANRMGVFLLFVGLTGAWLPVIQGTANPVYLTMLGASCALALWAGVHAGAGFASVRTPSGRFVTLQRAVMVMMLVGLGLGLSGGSVALAALP
jgi:geranylgeranylglycerol-phosphate geranylgeranyltransferase